MKHWTRWQLPLMQSLPPALRDWLTDTGSLTRLLQQSCQHDFSVELLSSQWQRPLPDEALLLGQAREKHAFEREVYLMDGEKPQIYARTVVPMNTYFARTQRFDSLGNQSLGEMLFNQPGLKRRPIQVACLQPGQFLFELATKRLTIQPEFLWARRSCFYIEDKKILVNEVFLPSDKWSNQ
ncbi:chorismate--pyruvate lyase family protein [Methylophaga sp.]|uniref:chorismate--pyruvate lyase family protein n=1 Tax=Methylophaga sp. TaxID=2024840 RepID=UPI003F6A2F4D